eukprot:CAMPEP_0195606654 /NCGR_PEP_ID=MMETSP0815-20121206/7798_1 /TAXON_ID=97485 /ORGANISM="Prymnesium parvum, Strain Texoma1" /LENGTH=80 /DNA_ID=CAMNT_0040746405 /DNA_START=192 /DNA_END=430 /DNA_ORIENTATION=-
MPPAARPSSTRPDSMAPSAPLRRLRYFPSPASSSSRSRALRAHSDTGPRAVRHAVERLSLPRHRPLRRGARGGAHRLAEA